MKNVAVFHIFCEFRATRQPTITGNRHTDSPYSGGRQGGRDGGGTTIYHEKQRIYGHTLAHFAIYCELCSLQITYYTNNKRDEDHYPRPDEKRHADAARYHSVYNHSLQGAARSFFVARYLRCRSAPTLIFSVEVVLGKYTPFSYGRYEVTEALDRLSSDAVERIASL